MYRIIPQNIPQDRRAEVNEKILFAISSGKDMIPPESVYNCYTGIGGLHGLKQSDYASYNEYAEAKREAEMGQFFTPHEICREMVEMLAPSVSDTILDMCCGMGNFFNHLPNLHNAHGFDIDPNAVTVAKYLYPDADIARCDIRQFRPDVRFDIVIGNPPFNLHFDGCPSQEYYMRKAYEVLNPAGLLMVIVPRSFMQSVQWEKTRTAEINGCFSFIGQCELPTNAFASVGVDNFATKIMAFMRHSKHIEMLPYKDDEFVTKGVLNERIASAKRMRSELRLDIMRESHGIDKAEAEYFEYKVRKYMYELKAHEPLRKHLDKAVALVAKFRNQRPPENCSNEDFKKWERSRLTTNKVLSTLRRYISTQNVVPRKEIALVRTSYGFELKQYAPRMLDGIEHRKAHMNDLILGRCPLPKPATLTVANIRQIRAAERTIRRKRREYELQNIPFADMTEDASLGEYLDGLTFKNKEGEVCRFTELQKHDLNLVMQKRYALLNWQQGSGKTAAVYHRAKYLLKKRKVKNVIVLAPAIAVNMTWCPFLKMNGEPYIFIKRADDWNAVRDGEFIVISTSSLGKLKRSSMRFVKTKSRKLGLVFDESDEITNPLSQRTKYALSIFRRLKYKILDTGTTTRNNITELYSQFELLYNNSVNMLSENELIYSQDRDGNIDSESNPYYGRPFPALRGHVLFKASHCPGKTTVFGIEKQNQDVYNKDALSDMIARTVITRKFKDFAGEKYRVRTHTVTPSTAEYEVYRVIIQEFYRICRLYYESTGDARKDAGLRLMRQIKLLIKACSVPHLLEGYTGDEYPSKSRYIENMIRGIHGKVAVGCTSIAAFELYENYLKRAFPDRPVFTVKGDTPFDKRQDTVTRFDKSVNGILVCTQQSLSSSVNIPTCNDVILESLQWNIPRMEQYYFRFIRLDSQERKNVHFITYGDSIEQNIMALVLTKERLNDFIKTGDVKRQSEIFEEFDISTSVIDSLLKREQDADGKLKISWGSQRVEP